MSALTYCANCGHAGRGNFCTACGTRLESVNSEITLATAQWHDLIDYDALMRVPEVRELIARSAVQSKRRMSGEQFLELCDKAFAPIPGVPLVKLAQFAQPFYAKLGVKTGKARSEAIASPIGTTIVTLLCAMAKLGYELDHVHQLSDGCNLEATLPSDLFSFSGTLVITVRRQASGTQVEAETNVPGQAFDWGKSTRALNGLFNELNSLAPAA